MAEGTSLTRLTVLTAGVVLQTREGCRGRIRALMEHGPRDLMMLCEHFGCGPDALERHLHRPVRDRRRKRAVQGRLFE